jgi:hypothetical protein
MACRQRDDLIAPTDEERVISDEERISAPLSNASKRQIQFTFSGGIQEIQAQVENACCRFQVFRLSL